MRRDWGEWSVIRARVFRGKRGDGPRTERTKGRQRKERRESRVRKEGKVSKVKGETVMIDR